jgi:hypothetical protein
MRKVPDLPSGCHNGCHGDYLLPQYLPLLVSSHQPGPNPPLRLLWCNTLVRRVVYALPPYRGRRPWQGHKAS